METGTHNGCKDQIPDVDARAPVKNGIMADPVCPGPAIQPIAPKYPS